MNEDKLYMPAPITVRKEYFTGFGNKEAFYTAISAAVAIVIAVIVHFSTGYITPCVFGVFIIIFLTITFVSKIPNANNLSMLDYLLAIHKYKTEQQEYIYQYMEGKLYNEKH